MSRGDVGKKATKPEKVKDATIGMICARCGAPAEYIATWQHPAQPVDGRRSGWLEQVALCTEHAAEAIDTDPPRPVLRRHAEAIRREQQAEAERRDAAAKRLGEAQLTLGDGWGRPPL